jgi:hypothetical protein
MFGTTMNAYTLFHTAEAAAAVPYLYEPRKYSLRIKGPDAAVHPFPMWRQDMSVRRRFEGTAPWLESERLLVRSRLGRGELLFIPDARALHLRLLEEMRREPFFLVDEAARTTIKARVIQDPKN